MDYFVIKLNPLIGWKYITGSEFGISPHPFLFRASCRHSILDTFITNAMEVDNI